MIYTNPYNTINYIHSINSYKFYPNIFFPIFIPIDISINKHVSCDHTHQG